jgi:phage tail sheath protein FI
MSTSDKADRMAFKYIKISISTPVDPANPQTIPVNDVDPDTGIELPMPLMGGADMFTDADYNNDMKLAPYIAGSVAHQTGVWAVSLFEEFGYKAMVAPYFSQYGMVSGEMVSLAENRRDFHVIVDTPDLQASAAYNWRVGGNHNSKFESIYYPWLMKLDPYTKKVVPVPPSGSALQAMALTQKNGKICDAPAGPVRGVIYDAVAISQDIKLSQVMRDRLYATGVNPIIKGLTTGICIEGQRTTYARSSPMQKVGTMIMIETIVRDLTLGGKNFLFDLSIPSLWATIQNSFQSYLNQYVSDKCLSEAEASVSAAYNPPIVLAQSKLNAMVAIKPSPYMEHLIIPISVG